MKDQIKHKVDAINASNRMLRCAYEAISESLEQHEGKQIYKADGSLMKRFRDDVVSKLNEARDAYSDANFIAHRWNFDCYTPDSKAGSSLFLQVTCRQTEGEHTHYTEAYAHLGTVRERVLVSTVFHLEERDELCADEQLRLIREKEALEEQIRNLRKRIKV